MNKKVLLQDLGRKDYKETWDYQEVLFKEILDLKIKNRREETNLATPNYFLFVEHPHVFTLGKSGDFDNLLISEEKLNSRASINQPEALSGRSFGSPRCATQGVLSNDVTARHPRSLRAKPVSDRSPFGRPITDHRS